MLTCSLFALFSCLFPYQGASSPEWVKPTAEGGRIGFSVCLFLFCNLQLLYVCFCFAFVYIAIMADGR
jgi:hypothetical protein